MKKHRKKENLNVDRYSTNIKALDDLLNGGLPIKKILNISREPGAGSTTMILQMAKNIISNHKKNVHYIDSDGGITTDLLNSMGCMHLLYDRNTNPGGQLYIYPVDTIEDIMKIIETVTKDPKSGLIVIDSESSVIEQEILDDPYLGTSKTGYKSNARMWSKRAKKINALMNLSNASMIITSQVRFNNNDFQANKTTTACNAIKYIRAGHIFLSLLNKKNPAFMKINIQTFSGRYIKYNSSTEVKLKYGFGIIE
jgi:RecA/RadA recombinase